MADLTKRLSAHGLDAISMVVEAYATGQHPELCVAKALLREFDVLLNEAKGVIAGIETGVLSRESAWELCGGDESAPETLRAIELSSVPAAPVTQPWNPPPELLDATA